VALRVPEGHPAHIRAAGGPFAPLAGQAAYHGHPAQQEAAAHQQGSHRQPPAGFGNVGI